MATATPSSRPPRIWISNDKPAAGDVVRVRAQIEHPMESGLRREGSGRLLPRHIVTRFEARLGDALLLAWEPGITIAQDPYLEFTFKARSSGVLQMRWVDDAARVVEVKRTITVAG